MGIAELVLLIIAIGAADCAYIFYRYMRKYKGLYENLEVVYNNTKDKMSAYNQMCADVKPKFYVSFVDFVNNNTYYGKHLAVV